MSKQNAFEQAIMKIDLYNLITSHFDVVCRENAKLGFRQPTCSNTANSDRMYALRHRVPQKTIVENPLAAAIVESLVEANDITRVVGNDQKMPGSALFEGYPHAQIDALCWTLSRQGLLRYEMLDFSVPAPKKDFERRPLIIEGQPPLFCFTGEVFEADLKNYLRYSFIKNKELRWQLSQAFRSFDPKVRPSYVFCQDRYRPPR